MFIPRYVLRDEVKDVQYEYCKNIVALDLLP